MGQKQGVDKIPHYDFKVKTFNTCLNKNRKAFYLTARRVCSKQKDDILDIIQDAVANCWETLMYLELDIFSSINPAGYIGYSIKNQAIKFNKKKGFDLSIDEIDSKDIPLPESINQDDITDFFMDNAKKIDKIKATIGDDKFRMLHLWGAHNSSYNEIAEELKMNESTVGTHINRAKARLIKMRKNKQL